MAVCEVCGSERPEGDAYCGACGHRLGTSRQAAAGTPTSPAEPIVVNVEIEPARKKGSLLDGCVSCLSWAVAIVVIFFVIVWIFSC